jgi:hypothetical protein
MCICGVPIPACCELQIEEQCVKLQRVERCSVQLGSADTRLSLLKKKAKGHTPASQVDPNMCILRMLCRPRTEGESHVCHCQVCHCQARQVAGTAMGEQARRGSRDHSEGKRTILVTSRLVHHRTVPALGQQRSSLLTASMKCEVNEANSQCQDSDDEVQLHAEPVRLVQLRTDPVGASAP